MANSSWQIKYIMPEYGTHYFYHEIVAESSIEAEKQFKQIVPKSKVIGSAKRL